MSAAGRRKRGRPPNADGQATAQRLLDAATEVCAEFGFDGCTVGAVADRAGVSSSAIYNHFAGREELLYAAAVQGIGRITSAAAPLADSRHALPAVVTAFLGPELRNTRRLIVELHVASHRDDRLGKLLADWHREWADAVIGGLRPSPTDHHATAKALFLLLLGLCHLEDLGALPASDDEVRTLAQQAIAAIVDPHLP